MDLSNHKKLLIRFEHGIGDAIQFQIVARHLKHYYPQLEISIELKPGQESALNEVADHCHALIHPWTWDVDFSPKEKISLTWDKPNRFYDNVPSTKVTRCLLDVFNLEPIEKLYRYEFHPDQTALDKAQRYIHEEMDDAPFGIIHPYGSKTSNENKNLTDGELACLANRLLGQGLKVLILDWEPNNPLNDVPNVFVPWRGHPWLWDGKYFGQVSTIGALIERAEIFMGVDSGPLHIAGGTKTPSIAFWIGTEPLKCFDLADNVKHLVPHDCDSLQFDYFEVVPFF